MKRKRKSLKVAQPEVPDWPAEILAIPDDEHRGFELWRWWRVVQIMRLGIPLDEATDEIFEEIRLRTLRVEPGSHRSAYSAWALRLAAEGRFAEAGRMLLGGIGQIGEHLRAEHEVIGERTKRVAAEHQVQEEQDKRKRGPRAGGRETAEKKKNDTAQRNADILKMRKKLMDAGTAPRDTASILAKRFHLSAKRIRVIVKKAAER
jgi:hypothetical protein